MYPFLAIPRRLGKTLGFEAHKYHVLYPACTDLLKKCKSGDSRAGFLMLLSGKSSPLIQALMTC